MSPRVSMLSLPFEVLWETFDGIARDDLRSVRLVCSGLSNVATPLLFASLRLRTEVSSGAKLLAVTRSESLRPFVRDLEIDVTGLDHNKILWGASSGLHVLPTEVARGLHSFDKFEKLARLSIIWDVLQPGHTNGNSKRAAKFDLYRTQIFETVLWKLHKCSELRVLRLTNLPCRPPNALLETRRFASLFAQLRELSICVAMWDEEEELRDVWGSMRAFFRDFSRLWLEPLSNITHLDLSMKNYRWGYHPRVEFSGLKLPYLQELRLGCFMFSHDWQLEWLSSLKTLESLYLDKCSMITHSFLSHQPDAEGYPIDETFLPDPPPHIGLPAYQYTSSWGHYFNTFATSLPELESFRVSFYGPESDFPSSIFVYMEETRYTCYYYSDWFTTESLVEDRVLDDEFPAAELLDTDADALKKLYDTVYKRRMTKI